MPATPNKNPYLYFMDSVEYETMMTAVAEDQGKTFECGSVVVGNKAKKYTFADTDKAPFFAQYPDAKVIAEGYKKSVNFTEPENVRKSGD